MYQVTGVTCLHNFLGKSEYRTTNRGKTEVICTWTAYCPKLCAYAVANMDPEGGKILSSDSSDSHYSLSNLSDPQCRLHRRRERVRDENRAEVLVSELVLDVLRCKECLAIQRALGFVRPGFIAESKAGNGTVEVVKIDHNTYGDEHLVEITFRRCPQAEYQPNDEGY